MALPKIGAQLLVFGSKYSLEKDGDLVLDCVKRAGYLSVEGGPKDAAAWKRKLDARGLQYGGSHTGLKGLLDPRPIIQYLKTLGSSELCNSGLMTWDGRTLADYRTAIEVLNRAGKRLRDEGIRLHYHNHDFEFQKVDGDKTGLDLLLEGLDFNVVDLCVDVGWVRVAGGDPASFLLKHKERIGYLHFKDHDGQTWAELGRGRVDWASVVQALPALTKVRWAMIEQDSTKLEPCDSATISRQYLKETFNY